MSRGPGCAQMRILETLAAYARCGTDLGWEWSTGGSFYRQHVAWPENVEAYERGERVEVWMIRRDTGLSAAEVSRGLRSLARQGHARLYGAAAEEMDLHITKSAKFACISSAGKEWLSVKKVQATNLTLSGAEVAQ
ncbi:MAG TPA: hypothetical protein VMB73_25490 [Acetobacteraceae bacterium]|nr:hypothetical protein [Acetobacteraceae bacterium]